jgi:hypothetical protein
MTNGKPSKRDTEKLWSFFMQGGRCLLCGEPLFIDQAPHSYGGPTIEHKVPINKGGAAWLRNRAISHHECNKWRGDRSVMKCARPGNEVSERAGRRPLVPVPGIWYSHFRLPLEDPRWNGGDYGRVRLDRMADSEGSQSDDAG